MTLAERLHKATIDSSQLDEIALREQIHEKLKALVGESLFTKELAPNELETQVYSAIGVVLAQNNYPLTDTDRAELVQSVVDEIIGNGPIELLLRDPDVSEIMVSKFDQIYIEKFGRLELTPFKFANEEQLRRTIERIVSKVGRRIDESSPMVDARMKDGSRLNAVLSPIAVDGATLNIRKFAVEKLGSQDLLAFKTLNQEALDFLHGCVTARLNLVISGGTGAGKTTTLNVLSSFIPAGERVVTIEDSAELQLSHEHLVRLEARPNNTEGSGEVRIRDLVRNALRMRPDRIVIGEVRDGAALDLLQAMNTGHDGSLTTVHANSPADALARLETMALMSEVQLPAKVIRQQISRAIDIVIQQTRMASGARYITSIASVGESKKGVVETTELFAFDAASQQLVATENVSGFQRLGIEK